MFAKMSRFTMFTIAMMMLASASASEADAPTTSSVANEEADACSARCCKGTWSLPTSASSSCTPAADGLILVKHSTTSGHSNHRCYEDEGHANKCRCQCADSASDFTADNKIDSTVANTAYDSGTDAPLPPSTSGLACSPTKNPYEYFHSDIDQVFAQQMDDYYTHFDEDGAVVKMMSKIKYHDLDHKTITFMPRGANNYDWETTNATAAEITQTSSVGDSDHFSATVWDGISHNCHRVDLASNFTYFGNSKNFVYFCHYGYLMFDEEIGDIYEFGKGVTNFESHKMIAATWDEFEVTAEKHNQNLGLFHETVGNVEIFKWIRVSEESYVNYDYDTPDTDESTFAITLDSSNGKITITHLAVQGLPEGIVGLSNGEVDNGEEQNFGSGCNTTAASVRFVGKM